MIKNSLLTITAIILITFSSAYPQAGESDLQVFGFFQATFRNHKNVVEGFVNRKHSSNTFAIQQMNIFLQKDLARKLSAFINIELLNNYSSIKKWGALNLEEAWVMYRSSTQFNVKAGLLIPTFNHLNEIKNRTPILPYIYRPLAYETSFIEEFPLEEFVPNRAYFQLFGMIPHNELKIDWAAYIGNSANINSNPAEGQTGVDTTRQMLVGGRIGLRFRDLKFGISTTFDKIKYFEVYRDYFGHAPFNLEAMNRYRFGCDLSFKLEKVFFEGEFINVEYEENPDFLELDKKFYYWTAGVYLKEEFASYFTYSRMKSKVKPFFRGNFSVYYLGSAYTINERLTLKAQYGYVDWDDEVFYDLNPLFELDGKDHYFSLACSVYF